jgi:hypothetical protein
LSHTTDLPTVCTVLDVLMIAKSVIGDYDKSKLTADIQSYVDLLADEFLLTKQKIF